jgi:hypothetical protein
LAGVWYHAMRPSAKREKLVLRKLRVSSKLDETLAVRAGTGFILWNLIKLVSNGVGKTFNWLNQVHHWMVEALGGGGGARPTSAYESAENPHVGV